MVCMHDSIKLANNFIILLKLIKENLKFWNIFEEISLKIAIVYQFFFMDYNCKLKSLPTFFIVV